MKSISYNIVNIRKNYFGTLLIIIINVIFYLYICFQSGNFFEKLVPGPGYSSLVLYGAKENGLIALGEVYRIFLPMFMHVNLVHLLVNMFSLWSVGRIFEIIVGTKNLFMVYIISGITGNLCSFALIPNLSVGASGSLFGILFCLYVIQKYEEQIAKQFKLTSSKMELGKIILFNIVLNIVFGFSFPIFDWACHLGGSIAGALIGFALTSKHSWNLKIILSRKKEDFIKKKFFDNHRLFYHGIIIINILFSLSYFKIKNYQKILGFSIQKAAGNNTNLLNYSDLNQFSDILLNQNLETNPNIMLSGATDLHKQNLFFAASKIYEVLLSLNENKFGSDKFISQDISILITKLLDLANKRAPLPSEYSNNLQSKQLFKGEDICAKPASLFMTLGFYQISSKLYECAYSINPLNEKFAAYSMESFFLAKDDTGLNQIINLVEFFDRNNR